MGLYPLVWNGTSPNSPLSHFLEWPFLNGTCLNKPKSHVQVVHGAASSEATDYFTSVSSLVQVIKDDVVTIHGFNPIVLWGLLHGQYERVLI